MRPIELTPRLLALARQVPEGARFADVGTDHARLPVWLLERGIIQNAIASDLREGPLEQARETARRHALTERLSFRLGDGLTPIRGEEADVCAIAGMGGIIECLGMHKRFEWTALPGYGFDGAMIAMLAGNHPIGVIGAAFFVSYLRIGADLVNRTSDIPTEMISILQSIIILLISAERFLHKYKQNWIEKEAKS